MSRYPTPRSTQDDTASPIIQAGYERASLMLTLISALWIPVFLIRIAELPWVSSAPFISIHLVLVVIFIVSGIYNIQVALHHANNPPQGTLSKLDRKIPLPSYFAAFFTIISFVLLHPESVAAIPYVSTYQLDWLAAIIIGTSVFGLFFIHCFVYRLYNNLPKRIAPAPPV